MVAGVVTSSPAQEAGLAQGDLLVAAGGVAIGSHDDLVRALDGVGPDRTLAVRVVRGVEERELTVTFGASSS